MTSSTPMIQTGAVAREQDGAAEPSARVRNNAATQSHPVGDRGVSPQLERVARPLERACEGEARPRG